MNFQKYNIKENKKKKKKQTNKQTKKHKAQELLKIIISEIEYLNI